MEGAEYGLLQSLDQAKATVNTKLLLVKFFLHSTNMLEHGVQNQAICAKSSNLCKIKQFVQNRAICANQAIFANQAICA